jgi:phosphatidylserine decarboxylase
MTVRTQILKVLLREDVNFLLTNRIPRRLATQFIGWFSRIEQPFIRDLSIAVWRLFSDLDLREAKKTRSKAFTIVLFANSRTAPARLSATVIVW